MRLGALLATGFVVFGLGLELYAMRNASKRMAADHIIVGLAEANRAVSLCGKSENKLMGEFQQTFDSVRQRAVRERGEENPEASAEEITLGIDKIVRESEEKIDTLHADSGCKDKEMWRLLRKFKIYAKK